MEPINILLVDDQPAKLLSYEVILRELNENLIKAHSGREALEHLLKTEVAVILVDVCMPDQDGFELVSMIREHPRYQRTAVIFVSAVMMDEPHRLRGYEAGAVDYVSVPVVPEVLRAKVKVFAELFRKTRDLERLNAQLEQRVAERTAALEASAAALKSLNEQLEQRIEERTREREEALAQLFEAQKMDTIGQLTGGVAHDFNNLLMAALGSLNLVRKTVADERSVRLLDNAIQAAERGAALTQRLLAFARRQELKPQPTDLVRLVQSMESLLRRSIGPGVAIDNRLPAILPSVLVDANQFELALLNLFINARDAMPEGGVITLTAVAETLSAPRQGLKPGNYVAISVADTGCGMDEATVAKATQPFYTTKGPGKGTGLGLSMVYGLTAQSNGTLLIESRLGEGTCISMWIPVAEALEQVAAAPQPAAGAPAPQLEESRTILVVDDDALVMMGTAAMIEDLGHHPVEAMSGREALEILAGNSAIELVVTDHAMPGMTGAELTRLIRERWPDLPVVLASGYAEPPDLLGLENLPRLGKPFTQRDLEIAIASAFAEGVAG
ncbi:two-component system sensor histidine kinase/response regulator [Bosea sp. Leaf344]|uniref:response regulator n=1 Tax=Bosea sp. Leaf344 TaxID=1736346 RepID=UPI0006FE187C|nr:response regulator [Bosea sp. Leaf344]KQU54670.1 two-component system sensor histidine kinase/response regulator [Bosea sp. Leaf344]